MKKAAAVIIRNQAGQVLLSKRSAKEENQQGKWENVGGSLQEGEDFVDAAHREVLEELGVLVHDLKMVHDIKGDAESFHSVVFEGTINEEPKIMDPENTDELKWYSLEELKDVDLASYTADDFKYLGWI